jgi:FMN phosphatase YigB (HAD superfamily)
MKSIKINTKYIFAIIIACVSIQQLNSNNFSFDLASLTHNFYKAQPIAIPDVHTTKIKAIVFDLDGVLSTTNKMQAFYDIGLPVTLNFIYDQHKLPSEKVLFDTLAGMPATSSYKSYNKGLLMPQIMIDWQTGVQSLTALQQAIITYLQTAPFPQSQKNWVLESCMMMTTPQRFISTRQTIPANIALLRELKDAGYALYILSNWDKDSFALFASTFPEIFTYQDTPIFDGIIISGEIGMVKPELKIFNFCLDLFDLQPSSTIFIDDEPANIAAAGNLGIQTVLANPADTAAVRTNVINLLQK